ncbi:hypothetical protein ACHAQA_001279 [Verticillium albo-atrum]
MADAEARKKMMEDALQLQSEFKNPDPDPFRKNRGSKSSKGPKGRTANPHQPTMPTLANRAPVRVPGLASSGRNANHLMDVAAQSVSSALTDVSNVPPGDAVGCDNKAPKEARDIKSRALASENTIVVAQNKKNPIAAVPNFNLMDDLMGLGDELKPNQSQPPPGQNDLLDLDAPVTGQNVSRTSGGTAFELFKLLVEGMGHKETLDLGLALATTNIEPDENFEPSRFLTAVEGFVKGDSSQGQVQSLLDSAVNALPALKHLKALSPQKRCNCRSSTKAVYGLSASKHNDNRCEDTAADTQDKLFRYVIASAQQGATTRSALQVFLWYHDRDCPDIQLAAQAYPILFGACPATAERADADPDGGLVVIEAGRNDGHVDDDLDDELLKACESNGFRKKRNRNRNKKGGQQNLGHGSTGEGEAEPGFGYNDGLGYGQENQAYTFGGEQARAGDGKANDTQAAVVGAGHQTSTRKKQTLRGLSSSRWA